MMKQYRLILDGQNGKTININDVIFADIDLEKYKVDKADFLTVSQYDEGKTIAKFISFKTHEYVMNEFGKSITANKKMRIRNKKLLREIKNLKNKISLMSDLEERINNEFDNIFG